VRYEDVRQSRKSTPLQRRTQELKSESEFVRTIKIARRELWFESLGARCVR
jgi:hypothetical protein